LGDWAEERATGRKGIERMSIIASKAKRTQRGSVALSPVEYRMTAVRDLFRLYAKDRAFRQGLRTLARDLRPLGTILARLRGHPFAAIESRSVASAQFTHYVAAVRTFAGTWGLDRIGTDGVDAVHRWLLFEDEAREQDRHVDGWVKRIEEDEARELDRRESVLAKPINEDGGSFGFGLSLESDYPGVDTTVRVGDVVDRWAPEDEPRVYSEQPVPETLRERGAWRKVLNELDNPSTFQDVVHGDALLYRKTLGAEKRILTRLDPSQAADLAAELDRIQGEYRALEYEWSDTAGQYERDLRWTFERLALARPVRDIDHVGHDEPYVYRQTRRIAARLGLDGFPPPRDS
jgi:hypothetical protein